MARTLRGMAAEPGEREDIPLWSRWLKDHTDRIDNSWESDTTQYFGSGQTKDIWQLAYFWARDINSGHVGHMIDRWVTNAEEGFMRTVPLRIRTHDSEQIPPFSVNTINTWLAIEGMFRHRIESAAVAVTLGHIDGMNRDHGAPVTPEAWDQNDKPWGSMYCGWDESILLPLIDRISGIDFDLMED